MSSTFGTLVARARRPAAALALATLVGGCEGGSGQSGGAHVFLTVQGFSLASSGTPSVASVPSSPLQTTATGACVVLGNNQKNPTISAPTALDNVTIQSYTVSVNGRSFTIPTAAFISTGTITNGAVANNTTVVPVILVPAGAKGPSGTSSIVQVEFRGRDGRGSSVSAEGAVVVVFQQGLTTDSSCAGAGGGTGATGATGGTGDTGATGDTGTTGGTGTTGTT